MQGPLFSYSCCVTVIQISNSLLAIFFRKQKLLFYYYGMLSQLLTNLQQKKKMWHNFVEQQKLKLSAIIGQQNFVTTGVRSEELGQLSQKEKQEVDIHTKSQDPLQLNGKKTSVCLANHHLPSLNIGPVRGDGLWLGQSNHIEKGASMHVLHIHQHTVAHKLPVGYIR